MTDALVRVTEESEHRPESARWNPLAEPYVSRLCLAGRHSDCPGGMLYYPHGIDGEAISLACSCALSGCSCAKTAAR